MIIVNLAAWWLASAAHLAVMGTLKAVLFRSHLFSLTFGYGPLLAFGYVRRTLVKVKALPLGILLSYVPSADPDDNMDPQPPPGWHSSREVTPGQAIAFHLTGMLVMTLLAVGLLGKLQATSVMLSFWPTFFSGLLDPWRPGPSTIANCVQFLTHADPIRFAGTTAAALTAWNLGHLLTPLTPFTALFVKDPNTSPKLRELFVIYLVVLGVSILSYSVSFLSFALSLIYARLH